MAKAKEENGGGESTVEDTTQYGARLDAIEAAWAQFADSINDLSARVEAVEAKVAQAVSSPLENIGDEVGGALHSRLRKLENVLGIRVARDTDEKVEG